MMLKAGFIGLGRMGLTHFSILNTHPSVKIVAVCDQSSTMLNILSKYIDVKTYPDHMEMLDDSNLDCVVISTPGDSHGEIVKTCLKRGLHVFVEKPFTMSVAEGKNVITELGDKSLVNQVGYVNRFNEVFMEVKKLIHEGVIGDVVNFSSEMYGNSVLKDSKSSWRGSRKTGGGCMYEFASHGIDLAVYLFDRPDLVAGSVLQSIYSSEVEDLVSSTFIYNKGFSGTVMSTWSDETFRKPTNIVTIMGTRGKIIADKHAYKIYLKEPDLKYGFDQGWNTRYITDFAKSVRFYLRGNEFTRQLDYFIDCIKGKSTENIANFEEGLKTDIVMEMITNDAAGSLAKLSGTRANPTMLRRNENRQSFWNKIVGNKEGSHA
ncbi:MAG TPA: Gfo/Idh/MocA family oxidoreductase [Smithellaceae bacterium]|nr:Gfo/Idh/MocA family oxidoreductase [Smithellaceae bacterium]